MYKFLYRKKKIPFCTNHTKNHKVFDPYLIIQFFFHSKNNLFICLHIYLFTYLFIYLFIYDLFIVDKDTYT